MCYPNSSACPTPTKALFRRFALKQVACLARCQSSTVQLCGELSRCSCYQAQEHIKDPHKGITSKEWFVRQRRVESDITQLQNPAVEPALGLFGGILHRSIRDSPRCDSRQLNCEIASFVQSCTFWHPKLRTPICCLKR